MTINADGIVLSGRASSTQMMLRIGEIVRATAAKANVINMLQVPGGSDAQQVMLQVRIAEVNRRALTSSACRSSRDRPAPAIGSAAARRSSSRPSRALPTRDWQDGVQRLPEHLPVQHELERRERWSAR